MGYTLSDIVNELLIELGEGQSNKFARFYQFGVSFLREQNMDLSGVPKVVSLTIDDTDSINLPHDYLNYIRIGVCGRDGQIHSLGRNDNLCLDKCFDDCGNPQSCDPNTAEPTTLSGLVLSGEYWGDNMRNGEVMGRFFGIGGGNNLNGYYRFDLPNGQIHLGGLNLYTTSIVLEYLADVNSIDGDFVVHPFLIEALKNYMYWKSIARERNRNASEKQMAMIDYEKSERLARIRFNSRNSNEWLEAFRHGNQAAVKW